MAYIDTLIDNFDDNSINTSLWDVFGSSFVAETGGELRFNIPSYQAYPSIKSKSAYDFRSHAIYFKIVNVGVISTSDNYSYIAFTKDDDNGFELFFSNHAVQVWKKNSGVWSAVTSPITYNSSQHIWWRLLCTSLPDRLMISYSPDGGSYTTVYNGPWAVDPTAVYVEFGAGNDGAGTSSTFIIDNVNSSATYNIGKSALYKVSTIAAKTKSAKYSIIGDTTTQKAASYGLYIDSTAQKTAEYVVTPIVTTQVSSAYSIQIDTSVAKGAGYNIGYTPIIEKTASYIVPAPEILDYSVLKKLKIGASFGPVTSVVLGRVPQNDNVVMSSDPPEALGVSSIDVGYDLLTVVGHGMSNGSIIRLRSSGDYPLPLQPDTNYYIFANDNPDTFSLAETYADAITETGIVPVYEFGMETLETGSAPWSFDSVGTVSGFATATVDTSGQVYADNSIAFEATAYGSAVAEKTLTAGSAYGYAGVAVTIPLIWTLGDNEYCPLVTLKDSTGADIATLAIKYDSGYVLSVWVNETATWLDTGIPVDTGQVMRLQFGVSIGIATGYAKVWKNNSVESSPDYESGAINTGNLQIQKVCYGLSSIDYAIDAYYMDNFCYNTSFMQNLTVTGSFIDIRSVGSGDISIVGLETKEVQVNNNQLIDDDRQAALPNLYANLVGIGWKEVEADTVGLGWHEVGDVVRFEQGDVVADGFISEVHLVFDGSIRESLVSVIPDVTTTDYQSAGGILKTLYNTEIKVDKQENDITSIVSQQSVYASEVQEDFTEVYQNIDNIALTIQKSGGGNLILNSVGFAKESATDAGSTSYEKLSFWDYNSGYDVDTNGTAISYTSSESQNAGGTSGQVIELAGANIAITQRVNVAAGEPLSIAMRVRNEVGDGDATITVSNDHESFEVTIDDTVDYDWEEIKEENFVSTMPWLDITIAVTNATKFRITDLRLLYGDTAQNWMQASSEMLSANVQFTKDGMKISDTVHDTETQVTYNEFSTRRKSDGLTLFEADDNGVITNDLTIKGVTNYHDGDKTIIKQITIPSSKSMAGVAWIKVV